MTTTNPGEAITLRHRITMAEKAVNVSNLKREAAINAACLAAEASVRAEEALNRADPKKADYNNVAAAYHEAESKLAAAVEAENAAWDVALRAEANLATAKATAKAAYAI